MAKEQKTMTETLQEEVRSKWNRTSARLAAVLAILVMVGLPLVFQDFYFNILQVKYWYYCGVVIAVAVIYVIAAFTFWNRDRKWCGGALLKEWKQHFSLKSFTAAEWAMLAFLLASAISTLQSEYVYESFWGNEGRYVGLFMIVLYTVSFFIITKKLKFKKWYLDIFLATGMIVCLIGILHYFNIDPIGFKKDLNYLDYVDFTSTLGNVNTYTSYVALEVGVSTVLFTIETEAKRKIWYTVCVAISLFALITGISDNAYLTLLALLGLLPFVLFSSVKGVRNYVIILAIVCTEFVVIGTIVDKIPDHVLAINGLFNVISDFKYLPTLTALLWILGIGLYVAERSVLKNVKESNLGRWIWLAVVIVVLLGLGKVLYDVNIAGNVEKYSSLRKYLLFNDDWGTHRGYIWHLAMRIYQKFPILHKLFGYGPDTFGIITVQGYFDEMVDRYHEKFDSVHNEYLQYLVTIGIVGMIAYISVIVTSVVRIVRKGKENPVILSIAMAVICYAAQAVVNISVPIVAPVMFVLMAMGLAACRDENE